MLHPILQLCSGHPARSHKTQMIMGGKVMPLLNFHITEGSRNDEELQLFLDIAHEAVVEAFGVPQRDRYQIVNEHKKGHMILQDTGLGFERDDSAVLVHIFTSTRPEEQKHKFYDILASKLQAATGLDPKNLMIALFENTQADWSFGFGRAQYITGELG